MADGESVFLREVEGDAPLEVELKGSDLPERGIEVGGEQRLVRTHYPGNRRASTQVLGAKEAPIELRGKLRDVWSGLDGGARAIRATLTQMRIRGRYCELSWGETIVARGYLRVTKFRILRDADIDYELTFEVDEPPDAESITATPFPPAGPDDLRKGMAALATAARALDEALAAYNVVRAVL